MTLRSGIEALSETERRCLRLAADGHSSKEIAVQVGTSAGMVDNHVASARTKLGGVTRRSAARLLVQHESAQRGPTGVQSSHMQPTHSAEPPEFTLITFDRHEVVPAQVREDRVDIAMAIGPGERRGILYDLGPLGRVCLVFVVAASIAVVLLAAPALGREFGPLANSIIAIIR